jgi:hypothetical protein
MEATAAWRGYTEQVPQSAMTIWNMALSQIEQEDHRELLTLLRFLSFLGPNVPLRTLRSEKMNSLGLGNDLAFRDATGLIVSFRIAVKTHVNNFDGSIYWLQRLVTCEHD